MKILEKTKELLDIVKIHLTNEHLHDDVSYTAFILSLLPIPVFQQCNQIIDRISSNKALKIRLDEIWTEINSTNDKVSQINVDIEKLQEIGGTVNYNKNLKVQVEKLVSEIIKDLKSDNDSEWIMETENWSYQEVLNSIIETDFVAIIAKDNSVNMVKNTEIKTKKTHLKASENSKNYIDNTKFKGEKGEVELNKITVNKDVSIENSGLTMTGNGSGFSIPVGGSIKMNIPRTITGPCPSCGIESTFEGTLEQELVKCDHCGFQAILRATN